MINEKSDKIIFELRTFENLKKDIKDKFVMLEFWWTQLTWHCPADVALINNVVASYWTKKCGCGIDR